jgi:hypothetical protein
MYVHDILLLNEYRSSDSTISTNNFRVHRMQGYRPARYNSYSYCPDRYVRVGYIEEFLRKEILSTYVHQSYCICDGQSESLSWGLYTVTARSFDVFINYLLAQVIVTIDISPVDTF